MGMRRKLVIVGGVAVVALGVAQMVARYYEVPQATLSILSVVSVLVMAPVCWIIGTMMRSGEMAATSPRLVATFIQGAAIIILVCGIAMIYFVVH